MGVMCSLLGHDYGDADVERERAEEGDEVVRTAKRVKRCHNCGHERTVSENKEVTTLEAAAGVVREPDGTVVAATDGMGEVNGNIVIETEEITSSLDTPDTGQADENESADESANVGQIDEIRPLEPERHDTGPSRAPGEWPEEPTTERLSKPETRESAGLDSSGSLATELRGDRWPDETSAPAEATEESSGLLTMRSTESESETAARTSDRRPGNTFACGSCGFTSVVTDSPLRAGDICPGCGHGYLAWETRKG